MKDIFNREPQEEQNKLETFVYAKPHAATIVEELINNDKRYQIAKAVLPAIIAGCSGHASYDYDHHCEQAIKYADELLFQLKHKP